MKIINTATENIIIDGPVTADFIRSLIMHEKLSNFRSPARQQEALTIVAQSPEGLVYIAHNNRYIVGYTLFHHPSQYTRWSRHPRILELGAIEVARDYQKLGIAKALLETAFENPLLEEYVVITTEFFWHWDLRGSRLDVWSYQKMLTKLFGYAGFKKRRTDDPEILEHPANMLMVRFGSKVPYQYIKAFEDLTYQNSLVD